MADTDLGLYLRGANTLVASWAQYARDAGGATTVHSPAVAIALFPHEPERSVYNNALFKRDVTFAERADGVDAMETAFRQAGIASFAAWVHESDIELRAYFERRGYIARESTRAMGMTLDDIRLPRPAVDIARADWAEHLRVGQLPYDLLAGGDHTAFHVLVARLAGETVATGLAFDLGGDCGVYNVGTLPHARRRGLGTALTVALLYEAIDRGCRTASLQSTPMAEGVYASVGFRDLGRILEYAPPDSAATRSR